MTCNSPYSEEKTTHEDLAAAGSSLDNPFNNEVMKNFGKAMLPTASTPPVSMTGSWISPMASIRST